MTGESKGTTKLKTDIISRHEFDNKGGLSLSDVPIKVEEFLLVEDVTYVKMEDPCILAFWEQNKDVMEKTIIHGEEQTLHTKSSDWETHWKDYGSCKKGMVLQSNIQQKMAEKSTSPCYTWQITKWLVSEKPVDSCQSGGSSATSPILGQHGDCKKRDIYWQKEIGVTPEDTDKILSSFTCHHCSAKFLEKDDLQRHINEVHLEDDVGYFQCDTCSESFDSKNNLINHLHDAKKICNICSACFCSTSDFQAHYQIHERTNRYTCFYCSCSFSDELQYSEHLLYHKEKKIDDNTIRPTRHSRKCKQPRMKVHCMKKPYECVLCPKTYSYKHSLEIHIRQHTREKMHKCTLCPSIFYSEQSLINHMRIHSFRNSLSSVDHPEGVAIDSC